MKIRNFISKNIVLGAMIPGAYASMGFADSGSDKEKPTVTTVNDVFIERLQEGQY
jgi:hypothetical protein